MNRDAGWYPDPTARYEMRYWDGARWTQHISVGGQITVEPQPEAPVEAYPLARPASKRRRWPALVLLLLAVAGLGVGAFFAFEGSGSNSASASGKTSGHGATTTTLDLAGSTNAVAQALREELCGVATCPMTVRPGVISFAFTSDIDEAELVAAGTRTGLWGPADAARMMRTRALDGTQKSSSGRATWTYHPDHGLQIVVEVRDGDAASIVTTTGHGT